MAEEKQKIKYPRRILMIAPEPFLEPRGTPLSVLQRLQGLSALGFQVDLATYHVGKDVSIPNVQIFRNLAVPFIRQVPIGPSPTKLFLDLLLIFTVLRLLLTRRYDAIHSHEEASFFAAFFAAMFKIAHIYDMHSSLPKQLTNFKFGNVRLIIKIFEILERMVVRSADVILSVGSDLEEHVRAIKPDVKQFRIENTLVGENLPLGPLPETELHQRLRQSPRRLVLYTGTFEKYQGLDIFLQAVEIARGSHPDILACLVGGKPEQVKAWKATAEKMGLSDVTFFTGHVPLPVSLDYLQHADVLVSPRTEGLTIPLKIYSYLHAGRPILATDINAHRQVLQHQKTALLTAPTPTAFASGLSELLSNDMLCDQLAQEAKAFANSRYTREEFIQKLKSAYASIGNKNSPPFSPLKEPVEVVYTRTPEEK